MSHYLDDFFGASDTTTSPTTPIQVLSLSAAALGFKLSHKKMAWDTTKLEILGIKLNSQKDIRFLEALAILEALRRFSPLWNGAHHVVVHVDNENVEYGLRKGSIWDPQTQVLFRAIFALCLQQHIDLVPICISSMANVLADALSRCRFTFIQQQFT
ncbi:uncharacterized protein UBRO2_02865 [Ustilago bromivora]|uniref:Reverse transcriptase domain-containing protein n=1 Tax=Ustilago bromivora TaxID=307758 RepID=A0A8H8TTF6_9BASI|nr:uncharacterized protein UBRO2_02865 [Ustilago bromivora]